MNPIAQRIKETLDLREVMEYYGIEFNRSGFAVCPFHKEKTASLSIKNGYFKCFGCGASGDSISFVQRYFNISFPQALLRLDSDFHLGLTGRRPDRSEVSHILEERRRAAEEKEQYRETYRKKEIIYRYLWSAYMHLAPKEPGEPIDGRYLDACIHLPEYENWFDEHPYR